MINRRGFFGGLFASLIVFFYPQKVAKSAVPKTRIDKLMPWIKYIYETSPHLSAMIDLEILKQQKGKRRNGFIRDAALLEAEIILLNRRLEVASKELLDCRRGER